MTLRQSEPIAIVGSACRFAGEASSPSKLWDILKEPRDLRREVTDRFKIKSFYHPDSSHHGHSNVTHAYLLDEDLGGFDAEFFGVKPVEAKAIDPQQRLLMEVVYEGLESAGMDMNGLRGSDTGVYVGVMVGDYGTMTLRDMDQSPTYYATGTGRSILSNRVSYFFDWHGPSISIDTACSSSLIAVHMAVQSLRSGESRMAVACGSNLILGPENFIIESKLKMLSPDGRSRMWDEGANGYARGEGVASIVLKTLSAALADGDHIECIIRETATNQDGATDGITMPSAAAQESLIRSIYTRAGLDLQSPIDRPHYFEAHGTGTPAGDPIEAQAIHNAFYGSSKGNLQLNSDCQPLYVGSIKTVLGHTEGTAGIAAVLKASEAIRRGTIPPNMLFNSLSDRVKPFYKGLEIPVAAKPWPQLAIGPRRASVNSFGFGGSNAHAILESYDNTASSSSKTVFGPLVFSALSEKSLRCSLSAYAEYLTNEGDSLNIADLAFTLRQRRTAFPYRASIAASSIGDLKAKLIAKLKDEDTPVGIKALPKSKHGVAKVLGIFTGQGAQYARMGAELIENNEVAREIIREMENHLAALPSKDRPTWSLEREILAAPETSRVSEAVLSQPLCTAIQVLLVDILRMAGIEFDAVVGHSSGEIAAAYAAGFLTARDAIYIAYYRGLHVQFAASPTGRSVKGAMVAVGSSKEDMDELCADEMFQGRISIAANNSTSSVTVSGDQDAIAELQDILDDEKKFNRKLRVDTAYHSNHMLACVKPYIESLRRCGISPQKPNTKCVWYSSVYNKLVDHDMALGDVYWADNMAKPVLFYDALVTALASNSYDLAMEVGAHPALKGPGTQTIQEVQGKDIPYISLLTRGTSSLEASAAGLGYLWSHLDKSLVDLNDYEVAMLGGKKCFQVLKGLPSYQWNHERSYWHETRMSRKIYQTQEPFHPMLGHLTPDSAPHQMIWKNLLRENEMYWLAGHKVQSQTVFPAAGYLSSAMEASSHLAESVNEAIRLIEIKNFVIHQAIAFDQDHPDIEVLIQMANVKHERKSNRILATFTYSAVLSAVAEDFTLAASGDVEILLGEPSASLLPTRPPPLSHVIDVETDNFYNALADLGYNFSGRFRSLSSLHRKHYRATCLVKMQPLSEGEFPLLIHPTELDAVLQSIILAYSYPYDEQLRTIHLPTSIQRIRINPALCNATAWQQGEFAPVDSAIVPRKPDERGITGHVQLYSYADQHAAIQVQGASFMPFGGSTAEADRKVFSRVDWISDRLDGETAALDIPLGGSHRNMVIMLERIATFYLRKFHKEVPPDHPIRSEFTTKWYLNYARYITDMVESGKHKWAKKEWLNDTLEDVKNCSKDFAHIPDVQIMHLVGEQMPHVFAGKTTILEHFRANDILDRYYATGFGLRESGQWVSRTVKQLVERFPHMNILEVGAGTGGATKAIFREIGSSFKSYTYTDISAGFFGNAAGIFSQHRDRMIFKTFNAENDPLDQGFVEGSYDLIVAFFVIHATSDLEKSLRHIRRLLKPGGFLVVGEGQEGMNGVASSGFIFGTLPGWWLGTDTGRELSPHVSPQGWVELLHKTGFGGVESHSPDSFEDVLNVFHFSAQAVDDEVSFLRNPLSTSSWKPTPIEKLVIVGGKTQRSARLVEPLKSLLRPYADQMFSYSSLLDVDFDVVDADSTVLSLTELDHPVFKDISAETFMGLKQMFESGKTLLWVTSGRRGDEPYCNMTVGFGRTAQHETPDLNLQQLDLEDPENASAEAVAEILLRFHVTKNKKEEHLWNPEPELIIAKDDSRLVTRLKPISELNDRYNSARRLITQEQPITGQSLTLTFSDSGCSIKNQSKYEVELLEHNNPDGLIHFQTSHAVLSALKTPAGFKYLVSGSQEGSDTSYLTLVSSLSSTTRAQLGSALTYNNATIASVELLTKVAAHLIAQNIVGPLYNGQTLLIHNAAVGVAEAIENLACEKGVHVVYTYDFSAEEVPNNWIKLHDYLSTPDVQEILLAEPASFVSFTEIDITENENTLISTLSKDCLIMTAKMLYSLSASPSHIAVPPALKENLSKALQYAQSGSGSATLGESVNLEILARERRPSQPLTIIEWKADSPLPVQQTRLDSTTMFKGSDSTYWIVGMSGALGLSLADWMISKGARNVVLTSRNPDVAPEWLAAHKRRGATVAVFACNVTNEKGMHDVHRQIKETLPPIVGVMNGAMVLRDVSIRNMSYQELTDVLNPKVIGSIILDKMFYTTDLDFFVFVSSINCVIGNLGQANYAAANTFMCALAAQRRKRGLRAATVNGGAIIGAGYMERESRKALDMIVQKLQMMRLSEEDWNQTICEAIDASRLESPYGPEITAGLSDVPFDIPNAPYWFLNPKFSSFIIQSQKAVLVDDKEKSTLSVKEQVQQCQTMDQVRKIIEHAFASQLRKVLQVTTSDEEIMEAEGAEIGLDSLVSVDIRSWFLNTLQVSIPVLKIMGNEPMSSLVSYALTALPAEFVPGLSGCQEDGTADSTSESSPDIGADSKMESHPTTVVTTPDRKASPDGYKPDFRTMDIDWQAEARPPVAELDKLAAVTGLNPANPPNVIVLTGAAGLLGHHLLNYFLENTPARKIHCLAVRKLSTRLANNELPVNPRVIYHEGDLTLPLLGLSEKEAADIFSEADVVIHNGSDTSHLKFFPDMRTANCGSTRDLTRLCLPRRIPFHYVSSVGVCVLYSQPAFPPVPVTGPDSMLPAPDGTFGYMCSKWVNERFLEQVHDIYGLPVYIHRPSTIIREGDDATNARAELDWVNALLHYAKKIKAVPHVKHNRGALDLVSIKTACSDILNAVLDISNPVDVVYTHEVGDIVLPLNDLKRIAPENEKPFDVLPLEDWIQKAVSAGLHPAIATLIEIMDTPGAQDYPRLLKTVPSA
ncbi:hypothetical protein EYB25_008763 [Talaromyces marneffei]|nr:hypothetical protein EYB25_008763 [Talaromyces marneffei]